MVLEIKQDEPGQKTSLATAAIAQQDVQVQQLSWKWCQ